MLNSRAMSSTLAALVSMNCASRFVAVSGVYFRPLSSTAMRKALSAPLWMLSQFSRMRFFRSMALPFSSKRVLLERSVSVARTPDTCPPFL